MRIPSCPQTRSRPSRHLPSVVPEQATETLRAFDRARGVFVRGRHDKRAAEALMWTLPIVVRNVFSSRQPQVPFAQQDELVQTFAFYAEHEALRESVQVRAPGG